MVQRAPTPDRAVTHVSVPQDSRVPTARWRWMTVSTNRAGTVELARYKEAQ